MIKVLHVDDEDYQLETVSLFLRQLDASFQITSVSSPSLALRELESHKFDCIVTDLKMPGIDGMAVIRVAQSLSPRPAIVAMSGRVAELEAAGLLRLFGLGANTVLAKPFGKRELVECIANLVGERAT